MRSGGDGVPPSAQYLLCFGDDPVNDLAGWRDIMNQSDGLAGNDGCDVEISGRPRRCIFGGDRFDILHEFDLAAHPAPRMIVDQAAAGERRRPDIVAGEIEDDAADAVAARRRTDAPFRFLRAVAFWLA